VSFLNNKKVGALLRCFAREDGLLDNAVALALASIERMRSVSVGDLLFISRIEVLVPVDPAYAEKDSGKTASVLRTAIAERGWKDVFVSEVSHGDLFVGVLNYGLAKLLRAGCDYGVILSKEAESYFTTEAATDLIAAADAGARVCGLAIAELSESICHGRIANTFAMWHLLSLAQVGFFDPRSAKPKLDAPIKSRAEAWAHGKNFYVYDNAGVEEIIPLIRLVRTFGPCIAPIIPRGAGVPVWKAPDPVADPAGYERHINKLSTKFVRQSYFAVCEHADPEMSFLRGGVMEAYSNL
jgi:hypothetical protein